MLSPTLEIPDPALLGGTPTAAVAPAQSTATPHPTNLNPDVDPAQVTAQQLAPEGNNQAAQPADPYELGGDSTYDLAGMSAETQPLQPANAIQPGQSDPGSPDPATAGAPVVPAQPVETPATPEAGQPQGFKIDGREFSQTDLEAIVREATPEFLGFGRTYANTVKVFNSGPDGARQVIETMVGAAIGQYGGKVDFSGLAEIAKSLDPANMTPGEKALYGLLQSSRQETEKVRADALKMFDEVKPHLEGVRAMELASAEAAKVNTLHPDAKATPEMIAEWKKTTGLSDPVQAYKVATYDARASKPVVPDRPTPPAMPRSGDPVKTYDPMDRNLSVGDIIELRKQGYVPRKAA